MKVAIRVDASAQIGTGHFMRCLTLADAWLHRGARVRFICRDLPEHLSRMLRDHGHESAALEVDPGGRGSGDLDHSMWLGTSQEADASATRRTLDGVRWDWLIVDHYALDARWESRLRDAAGRFLVIDDLADRHHDCDLLVDQNPYPDRDIRYLGKVPAGAKQLLGPDFAIIRGEFSRLRESARPRAGPITRMLIFFGGADQQDLTMRTLEALAHPMFGGIGIDVVIGSQHPRRDIVQRECFSRQIKCHVQIDYMAALMMAADLAIGAAGATSWERCCLGLPVLAIALAENQLKIAEALDSAGAGVYLGWHADVTAEGVRASAVGLMHDLARLRRLSEAAFSLVDGRGVDRVCAAMDVG